jgi:hypothetical protein
MIIKRTLEQKENIELSELLKTFSEEMHRHTVMEKFLEVVHEMSHRMGDYEPTSEKEENTKDA